MIWRGRSLYTPAASPPTKENSPHDYGKDSAVPLGLAFSVFNPPGVETPGYCRRSLRASAIREFGTESEQTTVTIPEGQTIMPRVQTASRTDYYFSGGVTSSQRDE